MFYNVKVASIRPHWCIMVFRQHFRDAPPRPHLDLSEGNVEKINPASVLWARLLSHRASSLRTGLLYVLFICCQSLLFVLKPYCDEVNCEMCYYQPTPDVILKRPRAGNKQDVIVSHVMRWEVHLSRRLFHHNRLDKLRQSPRCGLNLPCKNCQLNGPCRTPITAKVSPARWKSLDKVAKAFV